MTKTAALTLASLHQIDPELADMFKEALGEAVADCKARPGLFKVRRLTIELRMHPVENDPEDVSVEAVVGLNTPGSSKTRNPKRGPVRARRSKTDQLQFDF